MLEKKRYNSLLDYFSWFIEDKRVIPDDESVRLFLKWYNSFYNYEDKNQSYSLNNRYYISLKNNPEYLNIKIKERVLIDILKEINPENIYLVSTDYDDFSYWIDCIEKKPNWEIIAVDLTTATEKELDDNDRENIRPIDFFRHPAISLDLKKKGLQKRIYYFDWYAVEKLIQDFLSWLYNGSPIQSFLDTYRSYLSWKKVQKRLDKISKSVDAIL